MTAVKQDCPLPKSSEEYECKVCSAHATGFHFEAQSCSACCAFFRRAVSLKRTYKCVKVSTGTKANPCKIIYTESKLCRACRLKKCLEVGMNKASVQGPKTFNKNIRSYSTKSGLRRNKRFAQAERPIEQSEQSKLPEANVSRNASANACMLDDNNSSSCSSDVGNFFSEIEKNCKTTGPVDTASQPSSSGLPSIGGLPSSSGIPNTVPQITTVDEKLPRTCALYPANNILRIFVEEEMRIAERRRIMFCERPVGSLLGRSKACPFSEYDIKPLRFRDFRKSIRTHILLIYEWLRVWPQHSTLTMEDQITFLRKCVLYHTILDPCFITMQMGDLTKFVLPNGGYVSTIAGCDEGWQDEKEISRDIKKAMSDVSKEGRKCMKKDLDEVCRSLYGHYFEISDDFDKAERFGNILLLMSPIFDTATNFVESHHQVQFFDLWQLDSLLLQFLKNKS